MSDDQPRVVAMAHQELARLTKLADDEQARVAASRAELARLEEEIGRLRQLIGQVRESLDRGRLHVDAVQAATTRVDEWLAALADLLPAPAPPEGRADNRGLGRLYAGREESPS